MPTIINNQYKTDSTRRNIGVKSLNIFRNNYFSLLFIIFLLVSSINSSLLISKGQNSSQQTKEGSFQINDYIETEFISTYPENSWGMRSNGFALREDNVYTIIGQNPTVLDVSNKSNPTFVAEYEAPDGRFNDLVLQEDLLYVGSNYGLEIMNISNLNNIRKIGEFDTVDAVYQLIIQNDLVYLAAGSNGMIILNVSNPGQPLELGCYDNNGNVWGVTIRESIAFVCDVQQSLVIVNISNLSNPVEISQYDEPEFEHDHYDDLPAYTVAVNGSYAYVACNYWGLQIFDINNLSNPLKMGMFYGGEGLPGDDIDESTLDIYLKEDYAFVSAYENGLRILDVSDPTHPLEIGSFTEFGDVRYVDVQNDYAYLQTIDYGLMILELTYYSSNPSAGITGFTFLPAFTGFFVLLVIIPIIRSYRKKN
ncbi:MAG: hypothetical protein U9O98_01510 [Asgard group archaeon]|nr:hypothetical protein [Asgard group archaeon]